MSEPSNPIASLWRFDGTLSRQTYALVGFVGFAIKHNIDRYIARNYLHQANGLFNYWAPLDKAARLTHLSYPEKHFLFTLVVVSLPFIWVGVNFTVGRLRDAALPLWLVCLFFVPFVNVLFFLTLCLLPPKHSDTANEAAPWPHVRPLDRLIPRGKLAGIMLSIGVTTIIGLVCLSLSTLAIGSYGWSLFIALPFCMGLFAVLLHSYHEPRSFASCMEVSIMPIVILGGVLLAIAVEGIICLMMAAPIAMLVAMLGGSIGFVIQAHHWARNKPVMLTAILLVLPSAFFGE